MKFSENWWKSLKFDEILWKLMKIYEIDWNWLKSTDIAVQRVWQCRTVGLQWGYSGTTVGNGCPGGVHGVPHWSAPSPRTHYPGYTTTTTRRSRVRTRRQYMVSQRQWLVRQAALVIFTSGCSFCRFCEPLKLIKTLNFMIFTFLMTKESYLIYWFSRNNGFLLIFSK